MTPATEQAIRAVVRGVVVDWFDNPTGHTAGRQADEVAAAVCDALDAAGLVVMQRPTMPRSQRGRTVDHAVELHRYDDQTVLAALCGGLAPEPVDPDTVDQLDTFDPGDDHACRTCRRRLPAELRPADARPARPARRRDTLTDYHVEADVEDGEYSVRLENRDGRTVDAWPIGVELVDLVAAARTDARTPQPDQEVDDHGDI